MIAALLVNLQTLLEQLQTTEQKKTRFQKNLNNNNKLYIFITTAHIQTKENQI